VVKGAEELLRPVVDQPQGLPPKKLIVWGFVLLMVVMVLLSLITTSSEPPLKTSDEYAREVASKLSGNDKDNLNKGNTWVDEAYSSSGLAAQIAQGLVNPMTAGAPANAATVSTPFAPAPGSAPYPSPSAAMGLNSTASTPLASLSKPAHCVLDGRGWGRDVGQAVGNGWSGQKQCRCGPRGAGHQLPNDGGRFR
jgi:hypothetical protein